MSSASVIPQISENAIYNRVLFHINFSKQNSKDLSKSELNSVSSSESIRSNSENSDKSKKSCESLLILTKRSSSSGGSLETEISFDLQKFNKKMRNKNNP
jgi:hypothetical protein